MHINSKKNKEYKNNGVLLESHKWLLQRMTALILVISGIYFSIQFYRFDMTNYKVAIKFFNVPINNILGQLFIISIFLHAFLGINMILSDYVHKQKLYKILLFLCTIIFSILTIIAWVSLIVIMMEVEI